MKINAMRIPARYLPLILYFILAAIAFYQVSFHIHPVKWDNIDSFFPWRFYVGECLQSGSLPYWNPFQETGYPIHADPLSGAWYPLTWLIGYFFGYSVYLIGFEFWIHVYLAGLGFYHLSRTLTFSRETALIAGAAYMLSGFFVSNAQHLPYIISACHLPFILSFYLRMIDERGYGNALKAGFFVFLSVAGGYPAFTVILIYLLAIIFLVYSIKKYRIEGVKSVLRFLGRNAIAGISAVLFSAVTLISVFQVSKYMSSLIDLSLEKVLIYPFSPQSFISFLLPLVTTVRNEFFNSDLSMRNAYFGVFMFMFFVLGMFMKKPLKVKIFFWFGMFALAAAVGEYLPVRSFLYRYFPGMDIFKYPSIFRLFFIIGAVVTASHYIENKIIKSLSGKKSIFVGTALLTASFVGIIAYCRYRGYLTMADYIQYQLLTESESVTMRQHAVFQSAVQIALLSLFILIFTKVKKHKYIVISITALLFTDMFLSVQLNAPHTVYSSGVSAREASKRVRVLPRGFPPLKPLTIGEGEHLPGIGKPFWRNENIFLKQVSPEGYNSFTFSSFRTLEFDYPELYEQIKRNKVAELSDVILSERDLPRYSRDSLFSREQLFFEEAAFEELRDRRFSVSPEDTAFITSYNPSFFKVRAIVSNSCLLTLHQKEYIGWKAYVNGKQTPVYKTNLNFMTVVLPPGKNNVEFIYDNKLLKAGFYISSGSLLIFLILIFPFRLKKQPSSIKKRI